MWFKTDDGFYDHPKVLGLPEKAADAAISLWIRAGSWCGAHTDGHVPLFRLRAMWHGDGAVQALVDAGLWHRVEDLPGCASCVAKFAEENESYSGQVPLPRGDGYVFHDWLWYNPSKAQVNKERAGTRERVARSRARKRESAAVSSRGLFDATTPAALAATRGVSRGAPTPVATPPVSPQVTPPVAPPVTPVVTPDVTPVVTGAVTPLHAPSRNGVGTPAPTRPEPGTTEREMHRPDVEQLIERLAGHVRGRGGVVDVADSSEWHRAGKGLLDEDRHPPAVVMQVIDFSQRDRFWQGRVHTLAEVRSNWNKLHSQATAPPPARPASRKRASVLNKGLELDQLYATQSARSQMGDL